MATRKREQDELRAEAARDRQARQALEVQLAELRGQVQAQQQRQQPATDPYEQRLKELRDKRDRHLEMASASKDPATAKRELDAYHQTLEDMDELRADRKLAKERESWSQSQMDPGTQAMAADLASEFRWLRSDAEARAVADARIAKMVGEGHPRSYETFRAACAWAAQVLQLGGMPTNGRTNGNVKRFELPSGKNGAGGGEHESEMKLDEDQQAIADQWANKYHPNLSEDAGRKMWWNAIGKRAMKAKAAG